ncbi:MAG: uroporphyrinogen-III synthase [candidate division Zixibacteria bacterium]|nr:uroporphyrinogen-III synthase [candidate division Zixibacteria bacterium]
MTVLISRSASQLTDFLRVADDRNVKVIPFPLHTIEPTIDRLDPQTVTHDLEDCSWLLFTSANSVSIYFDFLHRNGITVPTSVAIGVIGKRTAQEVEQYGLQVALCPVDEVAEGLLDEILRSEPQREKMIIIPAAEEIRPVLVEGLTRTGYRVRKLDIYRSVATPRKLLPAIADEHIDYFCMLSSSAVQRYHELFGSPSGTAVSVGRITTATMRQLGWENVIELPEPDLNRLWEVIDA